MSYLWTRRQWLSHYRICVGYMWQLIFWNALALLVTTLFAIIKDSDSNLEAMMAPSILMVSLNFAICYAALTEINEGLFAGITCGVSAAILLIGFTVSGVQFALLPCMLALLFGIGAFIFALRHYRGKVRSFS